MCVFYYYLLVYFNEKEVKTCCDTRQPLIYKKENNGFVNLFYVFIIII
jgi:hypothetical protein